MSPWRTMERPDEYWINPSPPYNLIATASFLGVLPPLSLWALKLVSQWSQIPYFRSLVAFLRDLLPLGLAAIFLFYFLPLLGAVVGVISRRQINRRGGRGDFLGFLSVALGIVFLMLAFLANPVGFEP